MAKDKTQFVCRECGHAAAKWQGQCDGCGAWNTLEETQSRAMSRSGQSAISLAPTTQAVRLSDVQAKELPRIPTGSDEFDRVLGGGFVPGGVVLLGGDPGIGKSTLLLQSLAHLSTVERTLYVSGEESVDQVALRARRLSLGDQALTVLAEVRLEEILAQMQALAPRLVVIDSIQTVFSEALTAAPGSVSQVRECASRLTRWAKETGCTVILVGHVTKEGTLAGPRVLEHIVDTVLYFEGDGHAAYRVVRANKNRFGTVNEIGVFAMTDRGLKAVTNPSALFLSPAHLGTDSSETVSGACVMVTQEGSRPLLVEIQALVDTAHVPNPRRLSVGLEPQRLAMLLAVLHRHAGIACFDQDVFINAVGGVRINEPAADLPVLLAIVSSMRNKPLPRGLVAFGEIGLAGEIRPAPRGQERLKEAAKLGFSLALVPQANMPKKQIDGLEVLGFSRLADVLDALRSR